MVKIYIGDSLDPREVIISREEILNDVLRENGINVGTGTVTIDSRRLGDAELQMTIGELGITDGAFVTVAQKMMSA